MRKTAFPMLLALVATITTTTASPQGGPGSWPGMSASTRNAALGSLERGLDYLRQNQMPDGSWSSHEGITGLGALAFMKQPGGWDDDREYVNRALEFIVSNARPDGSIWSRDMAAVNTAISIMALSRSGNDEYDELIEKGRDYLVDAQFDDGEGLSPSDTNYGGIGYDDESRADLSNLHHVLEALEETGLPDESPLWDRAVQFIERTQNRSASNDQTWSGDDGGFVYMPGMSFAGATQSYGSMTFAGLMSYTFANLAPTDDRVEAAYEWIGDHYTVDENPGLGQTTLYYYYMVFAKALRIWGEPSLTDSGGVAHDWREDLATKLVALQHPEGYWVNEVDPSHWQDNPVLVTAFTSIALDYILNDSLGS